jgi:hypothetical protein
MPRGQPGLYEVALHEAGHLVMHAKVGKGYVDRVKVGHECGEIFRYDWSVHPGVNKLGALIAAGGPAVEIIRGRDPNIHGAQDLLNAESYFPDGVARLVERIQQFLHENWHLVLWTAEYLLLHRNGSGTIGARELRMMTDHLRRQFAKKRSEKGDGAIGYKPVMPALDE